MLTLSLSLFNKQLRIKKPGIRGAGRNQYEIHAYILVKKYLEWDPSVIRLEGTCANAVGSSLDTNNKREKGLGTCLEPKKQCYSIHDYSIQRVPDICKRLFSCWSLYSCTRPTFINMTRSTCKRVWVLIHQQAVVENSFLCPCIWY